MDMATFYMHLTDGVEQSKPTYSVPYVDPFSEVGKYLPNNVRIRWKKNVSKFVNSVLLKYKLLLFNIEKITQC